MILFTRDGRYFNLSKKFYVEVRYHYEYTISGEKKNSYYESTRRYKTIDFMYDAINSFNKSETHEVLSYGTYDYELELKTLSNTSRRKLRLSKIEKLYQESKLVTDTKPKFRKIKVNKKIKNKINTMERDINKYIEKLSKICFVESGKNEPKFAYKIIRKDDKLLKVCFNIENKNIENIEVFNMGKQSVSVNGKKYIEPYFKEGLLPRYRSQYRRCIKNYKWIKDIVNIVNNSEIEYVKSKYGYEKYNVGNLKSIISNINK